MSSTTKIREDAFKHCFTIDPEKMMTTNGNPYNHQVDNDRFNAYQMGAKDAYVLSRILERYGLKIERSGLISPSWRFERKPLDCQGIKIGQELNIVGKSCVID
ncbi:MAG: hypothetical protein WCP55_17845 [Lentisphaerota bacterium]